MDHDPTFPGDPDDRPTIDPSSHRTTRSTEPEQPGAESQPQSVGPYKILEVLGEGGMGVVYRAEQAQPRREVALKLIRSGLVSGTLLKRFQLEADILARLQHPGIAQVYQTGLHEGTPYFAMELIEGESLTKHARANDLSVKERLELFAKICDAVQHAHQKGVVHRDLKPGNILVDASGQPKILDFGVARATDGDIQTTTIQTDIGQLIGTIPYMSPEQASGNPDDIDTRSDVYALGVILYELLSGRLPYDLSKKLVHEAVRIIQEDDPTRLSSIHKTLRGDVETIVGKALEKEKERRYQSASALSADISRYLRDEPIAARPPSASYQLRKFAKRNRAIVTGVAAVFVVLVAGIVGTSVFAAGQSRARAEAVVQSDLADQRADEAEEARDEADAARKEADAARAAETKRAEELQIVADFQAERLGEIDPDGMGLSMRRGLRDKLVAVADRRGLDEEKATALLDEYEFLVLGADFTGLALETLEEHIFEPALETIENQFKDQPLIEAQLLQTIAETMTKAGLLEQATAPQTRALETRRRILGDEHSDTLLSINNMGFLLESQGKYDEAELYHKEAITGRRRILGDEHPDTLTSINNMGFLLESQGKYDEAELYYKEALEGYRRVLGDDHPDTLGSIGNMGYLLQNQGKLEEAEPYYMEALDGQRHVLGDDHPDTLASINNMSNLLQSQGKLEEAEPYCKEALESYRRVLGDNHPDTLASINNMGFLLRSQGKLEEAELYYREALESRRRVLGDGHPDTLLSINNMGVLLLNQSRFVEAKLYFKEAIETRRRVLGDNHPDTLASIDNMGSMLRSQGRLEESLLYYNESLEGNRRVLGDNHPRTLISINNIGSLLKSQGKLEEAQSYYREALEGRRSVLGNDHTHTLTSINNMGSLLQSQGKLEEAEPYFKEAIVGRRRVLGDDHRRTLTSINNMGTLLQSQGKLEEAHLYFKEALNTRRRILGVGHPDTLHSINNMGALLRDLGQFEEAESLGAEAVHSGLATLGPEHWLVGVFMGHHAKTLAAMNRFADAEPVVIRAHAIFEAKLGSTHSRTLGATEQLIALYEAWHEAEPVGGHDAKAAEWREKLPVPEPVEEEPDDTDRSYDV